MVVDSSKYEIIGAPDSTCLEFFEEDLDMLMLYFDTVRIGLFKANCLTTDFHPSPEVHNIAVGIQSDGTLSSSGRAALPCPPDCESKKITSPETITLAEYKWEGFVKFVPMEFYTEFSDKLIDLVDKYRYLKKTEKKR